MLSEGLKKVLIGIVGGIAILSLISATTIVKTGYTGVITRFGAVQERTLESGIHFKIPFIEKVKKMNNQIQILEDSVLSEQASQVKVRPLRLGIWYWTLNHVH